jgi:hypothetical protein
MEKSVVTLATDMLTERRKGLAVWPERENVVAAVMGHSKDVGLTLLHS